MTEIWRRFPQTGRMTLRVGLAAPEDLPTLVAAIDDDYPWSDSTEIVEAWTKQEAALGTRDVFWLKSDDELAGVLLCSLEYRDRRIGSQYAVVADTPHDGPRAYAERLYVRPKYRSNGGAASLLAAFLQGARDAGCRFAFINPNPEDHAVVRLYERAGFSWEILTDGQPDVQQSLMVARL